MKVLVYPHATGIGGSQLNAVEIAAAVRDRGHEVLVVSRSGPLVGTIERLGLPHVLLDARASRRPSGLAAAQLTVLARRWGCDIVHGYEWPPGVEAFAGCRLRLGLPVVCSVMSMAVAPFLPRTMPLIVGTGQIRDTALGAGRPHVTLIEPPVDVRANAPGYDPGSFSRDLGLRPDVPLVTVVSRLATELKLEGLLAACDAVGELASTGTPVQLVVVGDGQARPLVERAAGLANARAGQAVVTLAGLMADPRPAYAAADIVLGMGGSALRGLAFAKPVVVLGEHGFCELAAPQSLPMFGRQGWFGIGPGDQGRAEAAARLVTILRGLLGDSQRQAALGQFGRSLVIDRYSLDRAAQTQLEAYGRAASAAAGVSRRELTADAARTGVGVARYKAVRKWQRWRGTAAVDDFNTLARMRAPARNTGQEQQ
jgi:glycosyltransferase involved in cell wall biosynthesis